MHKLKGIIGVGKVWAQRHFVLQSDALYYSKCREFSHASKKKVCLVDVFVEKVENQTRRQHSFAICNADMRPVCVMATDDEESMIEWISALNRVKDSLIEKSIVDEVPTSERAVPSIAPQAPPEAAVLNHAIPARRRAPPPQLAQVWSSAIPSTAPCSAAAAAGGCSSSGSKLNGLDVLAISNRRAGPPADPQKPPAPGRSTPGPTRSAAPSPSESLRIADPSPSGSQIRVADPSRSKQLGALARMGFAGADAARALDECGGRLDDAVVRLTRR